MIGIGPVAPVSFCLVKRQVGAFEELLQVIGIVGKSGDSQAYGFFQEKALEVKLGSLHLDAQTLTEYLGSFCTGFRQRKAELIATIAAYNISGAHRFL